MLQNLFSFVKVMGKGVGASIHLNPIALRKAKIVCNFGLTECSRVKAELSIQAIQTQFRLLLNEHRSTLIRLYTILFKN